MSTMACTPASPSPLANSKKTLSSAEGLSNNGAAVEAVGGVAVKFSGAVPAGVVVGAGSGVPAAAHPANATENRAIIPRRRHTFSNAQPYIFTESPPVSTNLKYGLAQMMDSHRQTVEPTRPTNEETGSLILVIPDLLSFLGPQLLLLSDRGPADLKPDASPAFVGKNTE